MKKFLSVYLAITLFILFGYTGNAVKAETTNPYYPFDNITSQDGYNNLVATNNITYGTILSNCGFEVPVGLIYNPYSRVYVAYGFTKEQLSKINYIHYYANYNQVEFRWNTAIPYDYKIISIDTGQVVNTYHDNSTACLLSIDTNKGHYLTPISTLYKNIPEFTGKSPAPLGIDYIEFLNYLKNNPSELNGLKYFTELPIDDWDFIQYMLEYYNTYGADYTWFYEQGEKQLLLPWDINFHPNLADYDDWYLLNSTLTRLYNQYINRTQPKTTPQPVPYSTVAPLPTTAPTFLYPTTTDNTNYNYWLDRICALLSVDINNDIIHSENDYNLTNTINNNIVGISNMLNNVSPMLNNIDTDIKLGLGDINTKFDTILEDGIEIDAGDIWGSGDITECDNYKALCSTLDSKFSYIQDVETLGAGTIPLLPDNSVVPVQKAQVSNNTLSQAENVSLSVHVPTGWNKNTNTFDSTVKTITIPPDSKLHDAIRLFRALIEFGIILFYILRLKQALPHLVGDGGAE